MQEQVREWFEVNPQAINKKIFRKRKSDEKQEETRKLILEAFEEVELNPEKYAKTFRTVIPEKKWTKMDVKKAQEFANTLEGHVADWVEQALEWAQRIHNGQSWESICNEADKSKYYRMIIWKKGYIRLVGGSDGNSYSMSDVCNHDFDSSNVFIDVVPLIAS